MRMKWKMIKFVSVKAQHEDSLMLTKDFHDVKVQGKEQQNKKKKERK